MARRKVQNVESPLLPIEQVENMLIDGLGDIGAWSGGVGGMAGGAASGPVSGVAGAHGGKSGGRAGARWGARHLTRMDGDYMTLPVAPTADNLQAVREKVFAGRFQESADGYTGARQFIGIVVGPGLRGMNPCVVQLIWYAQELRATAHAREGLIRQRTCEKALQLLRATVR